MSPTQAGKDGHKPSTNMVTTARLAILRDGKVLLSKDTRRLPEASMSDGLLVRESAMKLAERLAGTAVESGDIMHVFSSPHQAGYHICMYVIDCNSDYVESSEYEWCPVEHLADVCADEVDALFGKCWLAGGGHTVSAFRGTIRSSLRVHNAQ
jgi:hypothetical protein